MAKKNLCGLEIEFPEDKEFHDGMFHCYGATSIGGKPCTKGPSNIVAVESGDGKCANVIAMCQSFEDAKAIVCAMSVAKKVVDAKYGNNLRKSYLDDQLRKDGYCIEAMEAKMDELIKSGKSPEEIMKYMNEHREDFRTNKPDAKPADDSKERW